MSSENFILFKYNNFQIKVINNKVKGFCIIESDFVSIKEVNVHKLFE